MFSFENTRKWLDYLNVFFNSLKPGNLYTAIKHTHDMRIVQAFSQGGGGRLSGYLPGNTGGACSFTVLDFIRACTQNCLAEWCGHSKNYVWTTQFSARQSYLYKNPEERLNDKLFNATTNNNKPLSTLHEDYIRGIEIFSPDTDDDKSFRAIAERIYKIFSTFLELNSVPIKDSNGNVIPLSVYAPCLDLSFMITKSSQMFGHSTAFVLEPPGNQKPATILFMDPNAGVIRLKLNADVIYRLLQLIQTTLYIDYKLMNPHIMQRRQLWIENIEPILNGETKKMERDIHGTGRKGLKSRETDYIYMNANPQKSKSESDVTSTRSNNSTTIEPFDDIDNILSSKSLPNVESQQDSSSPPTLSATPSKNNQPSEESDKKRRLARIRNILSRLPSHVVVNTQQKENVNNDNATLYYHFDPTKTNDSRFQAVKKEVLAIQIIERLRSRRYSHLVASSKARTKEKLMSRIIAGDLSAAKKMIKSNLEILLQRETVVNSKGKKFENVTPFQLALRMRDSEMVNMIAKYMERLPNGQDEMTKQYNDLFPDSHAIESQPFHFDNIVQMITDSSDEDIRAALNNPQKNTLISQTLKTFRRDFDALSMKESCFNPQHMLKALTVFYQQFNAWNLDKRTLFWEQLVMYVQQFLPPCYAKALTTYRSDIFDDKSPIHSTSADIYILSIMFRDYVYDNQEALNDLGSRCGAQRQDYSGRIRER